MEIIKVLPTINAMYNFVEYECEEFYECEYEKVIQYETIV